MNCFLHPARKRPKVCLVFLLLFAFYTSPVSAADPQSWFTENKGQVADQFALQRKDVRFVYSQGGFKLLLKSNGFSYEVMNQHQSLITEEASGLTHLPGEEDDFPDEQTTTSVSRIDITLDGCNPHPVIEAQEPAAFYQNFYNHITGPKGITGVKSFRKIIYRDIYPHIDLVFTIATDEGKKPEYSFIMHPGSDARKIQMRYYGAGNKFLSQQGELTLKAKEGSVIESKPIGFYDDERHKPVLLSFQIKNNTVSIASFNYNKSRTFVIDPVISWATYYGGTKLDMADEMAINSQNAIYVTGRTESSSMIATAGSYQVQYGGGKGDVFLVKFDQDGNLLWATYFGGEKLELSYCMTIDNTDHPIICGKTNSSKGIASPQALQPVFGGGEHDSYIAKFNDNGILQWSTYYGGEGMDRVLACTTDRNGIIYFTGYTESLNNVATAGAYKTTGDLVGEAFIMKMNPEGSLLFSTYFGAKGQDRGHSIAVDDAGNIVTIGTTTSKKWITTPGVYQPVYGGNTDMYLNKFTGNGALLWSTYIGGSKDDRGRWCSIDAGGNIYILGQVASTNIPTTPGTFKSVFIPAGPTDQDALISKFDSTGHNIWTTYYGGNDNEQPKSLKIDRFGSAIYISGSTRSNSGLATNDAYQKKLGGPNDAFFARINYDASQLMYSSYYGGKLSESDFNHTWYGAPMEIDHQGNLILASATQSFDSIAFGNSYRTTMASDSAFDFFVVKFTETCFDSYESNDFINTAPRLFFDGNSTERLVKSTLHSSADLDYYMFPLAEGFSSIQCTVTDLPADYTLTIFDANHFPITTASGPPNSNGTATINFTSPGNYYVGVMSNGSFNSPVCYRITIKISSNPFKYNAVSAVSLPGSLELFPNPANDQLNIYVRKPLAATGNLAIMSINGQLILSRQIGIDECFITVPLHNLASGTYLIQITAGAEKQYGKFVKQ